MPPVTHWVDPCGLPVRIFGGRWPAALRGYVFAVGVAWTLFKERGEYEIAYFLMQGLQLLSGLPVAGMLGKRIVMKFSGSGMVVQMTESLVGRLSLRFLRRWASRVLILNPGMLEEAKQVGFDAGLMGWMPNPVDTDQFSPCSAELRAQLRQARNLTPDTPVVVFVGRLDAPKELPGLVSAFALVVRERPLAKLVLIGDGPLREGLEQRARVLGLERNVIFTGRLDTEGVIGWLRASDVFTLISTLEGLPCSLIEAMSVGLASVVSDIPAHTQLIEHQVQGLITETGNQESIARGLVRLIDDPQLRGRLGAAARCRMVDQYSTPQVANCYEALFASVLAS